MAEAAGASTVTATLSAVAATDTTVTIGRKSTSTAALTDDFTLSGSTITIAAGQTTGTATLTAVQDTLDEDNETAIVEITAVSGGNGATESGIQEASVTITDDDTAPTVSVVNASLTEGSSGSTNMTFTVILSAASTKDISVAYATSDGSATSTSDYTAASGTLTFKAGEITKTFTVPILGDTTVEGNETFTVTLSTPTNATLGTSTATGTITNDEAAPTVKLLASNATVAEAAGASTVTATLSAVAATDTTVAIGRKASSTAALTSDFTLSGTSITIAAGQTTGTATLTAVQDTLDEDDESAIVEITAVSGGNGATESGAQEASVTITDDDTAPTVSVANASLTEGSSGSANMTFTVTLSAASTKDITVAYTTSDGTATATNDYTAASGTLTFKAGEITKTFTVPIQGDTTVEGDETFTVTLSSPTNATLGTSSATGTITNDEVAPTVTLSASNTTVAEAAGTSTVTVTLSAAAATPTNVTIGRKSDSMAALASDFTLSSITVTIAAGQTTGKTTLTAVQDTLDEADESAIVEITAVSGGNGATESGVQEASISITDDDNPPTVSVANANLIESNSGSANMPFTVTLSAASTKAITVNYATSNDSATASSDYTAASGSLTFKAGEITKTFSVPILGDATVEGNENFTVTLSSPTNATLGTSTATGTITNDEAAPTVKLSASNATVAEAAGASTVTATLSAVAATDTTVTIGRKSTSTAALPDDFTLSSTSITIPAGQTKGTATLTAVQDTQDEDNETAIVEITAVSGGNGATESGAQEASVTITDDDTAPTVSVATASLAEGNSGSANMTFTVTLSAKSGKDITVAYATSDGTATATSDYTAANGTLTFKAGEITKTFTVPIQGDATVEGNETFTVTLSSPTNATLGTSTATGTITNDEAAPTVKLSVSNATVAEAAGTSTVTATLSAVAATDTTVTIGRRETSMAALNSDFTLSSTSITIPAGQTKGTATLTAVQDTLDEENETAIVEITAVSGGNGATESGAQESSVTLTDDDTAPTVSVATASLAEGNSGSANMTFTASLSTKSGKDITVDYASSDGTAKASSDYTAANGTLTFKAGEVSKTFSVPIKGDTTAEASETFTVTLSNPTNATLKTSPSTATGTITDDDTVPTVSVANMKLTEGNSGSADMAFTVTLSTAPTKTTTVDYGTGGGTATAGNDYTATKGTLTFNADEITKTFTVPISGDTTAEGDETFTVTLSNPGNATLKTSTATGTITNDDTPPTSVATMKASKIDVDENKTSVSINVSLDKAVTRESSISYTITPNTAPNTARTSDLDAGTILTGKLIFEAGKQSKSFSIGIENDSLIEPDDTFTVSINNPEGEIILSKTVSDLSTLVSIKDNDNTVKNNNNLKSFLQDKPVLPWNLDALNTLNYEIELDGDPYKGVNAEITLYGVSTQQVDGLLTKFTIPASSRLSGWSNITKYLPHVVVDTIVVNVEKPLLDPAQYSLSIPVLPVNDLVTFINNKVKPGLPSVISGNTAATQKIKDAFANSRTSFEADNDGWQLESSDSFAIGSWFAPIAQSLFGKNSPIVTRISALPNIENPRLEVDGWTDDPKYTLVFPDVQLDGWLNALLNPVFSFATNEKADMEISKDSTGIDVDINFENDVPVASFIPVGSPLQTLGPVLAPLLINHASIATSGAITLDGKFDFSKMTDPSLSNVKKFIDKIGLGNLKLDVHLEYNHTSGDLNLEVTHTNATERDLLTFTNNVEKFKALLIPGTEIKLLFEKTEDEKSVSLSTVLKLGGYDPTQTGEPVLDLTGGVKLGQDGASVSFSVDPPSTWENPFGMNGVDVRHLAATISNGAVSALGLEIDWVSGRKKIGIDGLVVVEKSNRGGSLTIKNEANLADVWNLIKKAPPAGFIGLVDAPITILLNVFQGITVVSIDSDKDGVLDPFVTYLKKDFEQGSRTYAGGYGINARIEVWGKTGTLILNSDVDYSKAEGNLRIEPLTIPNVLTLSGTDGGDLTMAFSADKANLGDAYIRGDVKLTVLGILGLGAKFEGNSTGAAIRDFNVNLGVIELKVPLLKVDLGSTTIAGRGNISLLGQSVSDVNFNISDKGVTFNTSIGLASLIELKNVNFEWLRASGDVTATGGTVRLFDLFDLENVTPILTIQGGSKIILENYKVYYSSLTYTINQLTIDKSSNMADGDGNVSIAGINIGNGHFSYKDKTFSITAGLGISVSGIGSIGIKFTADSSGRLKLDIPVLGQIDIALTDFTPAYWASLPAEIAKQSFLMAPQYVLKLAENAAGSILDAGSAVLDFGIDAFDSIAGFIDSILGGDTPHRSEGGPGNDTDFGGTKNDILIGRGGNDYYDGHGGEDILDGGPGNDTLDGAGGNDTVFGGDGNDRISGGWGEDNLYGWGGDDFIAGDSYNIRSPDETWGHDNIFGGDGNDTLEGGLLNDTIYGGNGNDYIVGDYIHHEGGTVVWYHQDGYWGRDFLYGNDGNDTLIGSAESDRIDGGAGNDTIYGDYSNRSDTGQPLSISPNPSNGNDPLWGIRLGDTLIGGPGADRFVYITIKESIYGKNDIISDFSSAEGDKIDLSALTEKFTFIGTKNFLSSNAPYELRFESSTSSFLGSPFTSTALQGDVNRDGTPDFVISLTGVTSLSINDFIGVLSA